MGPAWKVAMGLSEQQRSTTWLARGGLRPTRQRLALAGLLNEVVVDGARSYFDTRLDDHPHFYWEDTHALTDAPAEELVIAGLPEAPQGMAVSRVDVVIRLKRA